MLKLIIRIAIPLFLIAATTGNVKPIATAFAGFPFVFPVLYEYSEISHSKIIQSAVLGSVGTALSVILMCVFEIYSTKLWLLPALVGFGICNVYFKAFVKKREEKSGLLKYIFVFMIFILCIYI